MSLTNQEYGLHVTMNLGAELLLRVRHAIGPLLGLFIMAYFAYHVIHGDRGLLAMMRLEQQVGETRARLSDSKARVQAIEHSVNLLRPENIDPDMLEERARKMLNYGFDNEVVIFEQPPTGPCRPFPRLP